MKRCFITIVPFLAGCIVGGYFVGEKLNSMLCVRQETSEKFRIMFDMMDHWMRGWQKDRSLADLLSKKGFQNIVIYGMGSVGSLLCKELKNSKIFVKYGIDRSPYINADIKVYSPESADLPEVDAVIVTAIAYFDNIEKELKKLLSCPIISLEEIVYDM